MKLRETKMKNSENSNFVENSHLWSVAVAHEIMDISFLRKFWQMQRLFSKNDDMKMCDSPNH